MPLRVRASYRDGRALFREVHARHQGADGEELDVDNLSEETRKGMSEKAEQGIWPSYAPLGYRNSEGPGRLCLTPIQHPSYRDRSRGWLRDGHAVAQRSGKKSSGCGARVPQERNEAAPRRAHQRPTYIDKLDSNVIGGEFYGRVRQRMARRSNSACNARSYFGTQAGRAARYMDEGVQDSRTRAERPKPIPAAGTRTKNVPLLNFGRSNCFWEDGEGPRHFPPTV